MLSKQMKVLIIPEDDTSKHTRAEWSADGGTKLFLGIDWEC